jgi:hypothetical protein
MGDTEEQSNAVVEEPDETVGEQPDEEPDDADTFPRAYVEKLRNESKGYRERAKTAEANLDATLRELFAVKVAATGKLADSEDLPYDAELLADEDKLTEAIDELIKRKPHLAARRVSGSVGQGVTGTRDEPFSLIGRLQRSV